VTVKKTFTIWMPKYFWSRFGPKCR